MRYLAAILVTICVLLNPHPVRAEIGGGAGIGNFTGAVGVTGNSGNGSDHINKVCRDGVCPVTAFGAVGNGTADDTAAVQATYNACASGQRVYFPRGNYKITSQVTIPTAAGTGVCPTVGDDWTGLVTGYGQTPNVQGSVINCAMTSGTCLDYEPPGGYGAPLVFRGIVFTGPGTGTATCFQDGNSTGAASDNFGKKEHVGFVNCAVGYAFNGEDNELDHLVFWGNNVGMLWAQTTANENTLPALELNGNNTGMSVTATNYGNRILGGLIQSNGTGISMTMASFAVSWDIRINDMESNTNHGMQLKLKDSIVNVVHGGVSNCSTNPCTGDTVEFTGTFSTVLEESLLSQGALQCTGSQLLMIANYTQGIVNSGCNLQNWGDFGIPGLNFRNGTGNVVPPWYASGLELSNLSASATNAVRAFGSTTVSGELDTVNAGGGPVGVSYNGSCGHVVIQPGTFTATFTVPTPQAACNNTTSCTLKDDGATNLVNTGAGQSWLSTGYVAYGQISGACSWYVATGLPINTGSNAATIGYSWGSAGNIIGQSGSNVQLGNSTTFLQPMNPLTALGGGAAPTLGTIGGTGPATAAQNTWLKMTDSTGASFFLPAWK